MSLRVGDTLGSFEILASIGAGGMGDVYRARDTRIGRDVAIKVSREAFSERVSREAQAVAALNHPNICTLHDVGPDYLVMELVEGPTLAERILEGPLPLDEALAIARQISAALEAAHERGIVHRDLKPGNIKLTPSGAVKVLDFGLAKLTGAATASSDNSPTLSIHATQAGVILGTAAYMSPEQARGKAVDKRADIWAFGVVLYEMVTGKRLFEGEDLTETLASVVKVEPVLSDAPRPIQRLLKKCLEKDPRKRLRDIGDAWELLETDEATPPVAPASKGRATLVPWLAAATLLLALAALAFVHLRETPAELQPVQFTLEAPAETAFQNLFGGYAVSPDGRYVVFTAVRRGNGTVSLWLRPMESTTSRPLPGTDGGNFPAWSPDSRSLVFFADGKLRRIDIAGGAPLTLADADADAVTPTGAWNRDGVILFGSARGLQRTTASGGVATALTKVAENESGHGYPQFLPDGRRFLYFVASSDPNVQGVYGSSLARPSERRQIVRTAAKAIYVPARGGHPAYLLWLQDQTLLAQRFDAGSLERSGDPVSVAENIGLNTTIPIRAAYWASDAGLLSYFNTDNGIRRRIAWMGRDGKALGDALVEADVSSPVLSPDAQRIALARVSPATGRNNTDIWVWDVTRKTMTRVTTHESSENYPVWSPDGATLAFASDSEAVGVFQIFRRSSSGTGTDERLTDGPRNKEPLHWSRDGRYLLYRERAVNGNYDLMALPLEGDRKPIPVVTSPFNENIGSFSPDGSLVAYRGNETGRFELYVEAFSGGRDTPRAAGRLQISNSGASDMSWRDDGRELYYEDNTGRIMAVTIEAGPGGVRAGTPHELFVSEVNVPAPHSMNATGDGERFLLFLNTEVDGDANRLTIVSNWQAALRR
jgi:Tol biopolymer transport system component